MTEKNKSFVAKLDPRSKIIVLLLLIITVFFVDNFTKYLILIFYIVILSYLSKINFYQIIKKSKIYLLMGLITGVFNIFFIKNGKLIFDLKLLKIYDKPLIITLQVMTQIFLVIIIVEIFTLTTKTNDIMKGINYLLNKKNKNSEISLMFTISIQFINIIKNELKQIIKIQKSRGEDFSKISLKNIKKIFLIIIPLFRITLEKINVMAEMLEVKNYVLNGEKTEFEKLKWKNLDTIYILITIFTIIFVLLV